MSDLLTIRELAAALDVHENSIRNWCKKGKIPFTLTKGGHRRFDLGLVRKELKSENNKTLMRKFKLEGLAEDQIWSEIQSELDLNKSNNARDVTMHAFTEMLNNAIDHSKGSEVSIEFTENPEKWKFSIKDDGIGVFASIKRTFQLDDDIEAIGELTKGKRTSQPERHSGEGIFFTSKMVTKFKISANGLEWVVDNEINDFAVGESDVKVGTLVNCEVSTSERIDMEAIYSKFSINHDFQNTQPVVKLFEIGGEFVSRSEAKRLMAGMGKFKKVTLDFLKVERVGQGFLDEIFRVWQNDHSEVEIESINMAPPVEFMVSRAK